MFWIFGQEACGSLAPQPGIEPALHALKGHWATREVPYIYIHFQLLFHYRLLQGYKALNIVPCAIQ